MTTAANHLLRALYLHALAPSTANQDAVRAAGAALDTETGRKLNAPRDDTAHLLATEANAQRVMEDVGQVQCTDTVVAEVIAEFLTRSARGIAKYGVTLDRKDLGLREWLVHFRDEQMDGVLYATRAMRELAAPAPVEPPHAAAPFLATLTPEPAEAVLGRAGEALAWDGRQLPVWVEYKPGTRHPYGDAAFHVAAHVTPDGKARLFPSKEAANVWLCANGTVPV